jgi:hypothetical protein
MLTMLQGLMIAFSILGVVFHTNVYAAALSITAVIAMGQRSVQIILVGVSPLPDDWFNRAGYGVLLSLAASLPQQPLSDGDSTNSDSVRGSSLSSSQPPPATIV